MTPVYLGNNRIFTVIAYIHRLPHGFNFLCDLKLWPPTLIPNLTCKMLSRTRQPVSQIPRSKFISFTSCRPDSGQVNFWADRHTQPTDCFTWSTKWLVRKCEQVSTVMAAKNGWFNRIRQQAPACTPPPSNTWFIGPTRESKPKRYLDRIVTHLYADRSRYVCHL